MIHRSAAALQPADWKSELRRAVSDVGELLRLTGNEENMRHLALPDSDFPLRVPHPYIRRIRPGDPQDPLLRQVLPLREELLALPGYGSDPLGEAAARIQSGVIHKYHGRVLLILTGACAVNCRYCFRRHFPYEENRLGTQEWTQALDYLRQDSSISEVILSGGDPLLLSDSRLAQLAAQLAAIPHLRRLRIHTRLPILIPQRITAEFLDWFAASRLQPILVLHSNHAAELDDEVGSALTQLQGRGISLLNQSVLLRGVNNQAEVLIALSERLFALGVLPYYLHLLDKVAGAGHFDVEEAQAQQLVAAMAARLPGYLVPRLTREQAGKPAKTLIPIPLEQSRDGFF